jgi:hypothetical protein
MSHLAEEKPHVEHEEYRTGSTPVEHFEDQKVVAAHSYDPAWERKTLWKIDLRLLVIREYSTRVRSITERIMCSRSVLRCQFDVSPELESVRYNS